MGNYFVLIKCCNCNSENCIEQVQGKPLPEKVVCYYCKCKTHTNIILGPPADPLKVMDIKAQ